MQPSSGLWAILSPTDNETSTDARPLEEDEPFDLNDIPDDRETSTALRLQSPSNQDGLSRSNVEYAPKKKKDKKKSKKPKKKRSVDFTPEEMADVRKREPEAFDEYAMSDDNDLPRDEAIAQPGLEHGIVPIQPEQRTMEGIEYGEDYSHQPVKSKNNATTRVGQRVVQAVPSSGDEGDDWQFEAEFANAKASHDSELETILEAHKNTFTDPTVQSSLSRGNGSMDKVTRRAQQFSNNRQRPASSLSQNKTEAVVENTSPKRKRKDDQNSSASAEVQPAAKKVKSGLFKPPIFLNSNPGPIAESQSSMNDFALEQSAGLEGTLTRQSSAEWETRPRAEASHPRETSSSSISSARPNRLRTKPATIQRSDDSSADEVDSQSDSTESRPDNPPKQQTKEWTHVNHEKAKAEAEAGSSLTQNKNKAISSTKSQPSKTNGRLRKQHDLDTGQADYGMATVVARKGPSTMPKGNTKTQNRINKTDSFDSDVTTSEESESTFETGSNLQRYECKRCHKKFISKQKLEKHRKDPGAHLRLAECEVCGKKFESIIALAQHQDEKNHRNEEEADGKSGRFSDRETKKLHQWRDRFCDEHDITQAQFNDMMTATLRKGTWTYPFIEKADFMEEYYDVLPHRGRRSMRRYRERTFQNVDMSFEWSREDDAELARLVKEIGPKWVKIGEQLTRSSDVVRQRWKMQHQLPEKKETGDWSAQERELFRNIVEELQREGTPGSDNPANAKIPWTQVSKRMKTRTPRQCSNHWRALHYQKVGGRWIKPGAAVVANEALPAELPVEPRKATSTPKKRSNLSAAFIADSDHDFHRDDEPQVISTGRTSVLDRQINSEEEPDDQYDLQFETTEIPAAQRTSPQPVYETPKGMTTSQAFLQTQANTSVPHSVYDTRPPPSQPRPSPNISIRHSRFSSPMLLPSDREPRELESAVETESHSKSEDRQSEEDLTSSSGTSSSTSTQTSSAESQENSGATSSEEQQSHTRYGPDSMINETRADWVKEFTKTADNVQKATQKKKRLGHKHLTFDTESEPD